MKIPDIAALAAFHTTVAMAGAGTMALLVPGRRAWAEFAAFAWLVGGVAISLALFVFSLVLPLPWNTGAVIFLAAILGMLGWLRMRRSLSFLMSFWSLFRIKDIRDERDPGRCPRLVLGRAVGLEWLLLTGILAGIAWCCWQLAHQTLGWDGLLIWEFKARLIFENGGAMPLRYYRDPSLAFSHPGYPQFLPYFEAWYCLLRGDLHQPAIQWLLFPFYPATLVLLGVTIRRMGGSRNAALLAAALFPFIPYPLAGIGSLGAGYSDFPLATFYLAAVAALLGGDLALFAVLAGALPWLKRDGLLLWGCLIMLAPWCRQFNWKRALIAALPGLLFIVAWQAWLKHVGAETGTGDDFLPISFSLLLRNLPRAPALAGETTRELVNPQHWSLLWLFFVGACVLRLRALTRRECDRIPNASTTLIPILAVLIPMLAEATLFHFSSWPSYVMHFRAAFPRLVLQLAPLAWAVTILSAESDKERGGLVRPGLSTEPCP